MTPLEEKLRRAIQAKAGEVPPEAVAPLRLSAHRRRSSSLAHGGGERGGAPARRGWLAPVASAAVVVALIAVSVAVSRSLAGQQKPPQGQQHEPVAISPARAAAAWVATQVSRADLVSCDLAMCDALETHGFPTSSVLVLDHGPGAHSQAAHSQALRSQALRSQVIVMTATARTDVGAQFTSRYAPAVIASFGSGSARIDVRVVTPKGAAAYRSALATDLAARRMATTELLNSPRVTTSAAARGQLRAMRVDERLVIMISYLATLGRVSVVSFGDAGPGAGASAPLRSAELAIETKSGRPATRADLEQAVTTVKQSLTPYRATLVEIIRLGDGRDGLSVEYAAPTPLGIISYNG
jgi:hypothetical protein